MPFEFKHTHVFCCYYLYVCVCVKQNGVVVSKKKKRRGTIVMWVPFAYAILLRYTLAWTNVNLPIQFLFFFFIFIIISFVCVHVCDDLKIESLLLQHLPIRLLLYNAEFCCQYIVDKFFFSYYLHVSSFFVIIICLMNLLRMLFVVSFFFHWQTWAVDI